MKELVPVLCALLLSACTTVDTPQLEPEDVPDEWLGPVPGEGDVWPQTDWWQAFGADELNAIISGVRANNLDLANNRRNLQAARLTLREAGFNLLPTPLVTLGTGTAYRDDLGGGEATPSPDTPVELSAGVSYNDILSKPVVYERALADYASRRAQLADSALNTLGTAASTYFQILLIRDRIVAARQNLENAEAIGRITEARVDAGVAVPIDALQQSIAIEQQRTELQSLEQDELEARAALALLLGRSVQDFGIEGETLEAIAVPELRPGLPSELLRRRPDLVQAEADLRASVAAAELAQRAFFPRISLTGSASSSSASLSGLLSSPDSVLTVSSDLVQTLLDNGQRSRNREQARLSLENALNDYRSAVLDAFNEIEVLLSNIRLLAEQESVARGNLEAAEEAFRIAELRYGEGVAEFQTVLTAQNTLFASRTAYLSNRIQRLNALVGFYQALGGGWDADNESTMSIVESEE